MAIKILKSFGYEINLEDGAFTSLKKFIKTQDFSHCFILCDENTLRHCLPILITKCPILSSAEIIELESGETSKDLSICEMIWQTLLENKADRKTLLINLGGGVVSDIGGFAASIYKRGINFINIPTSLLAIADASVGGKTGIDFHDLKNMLGTFAQPKGVFINTEFLKTLPDRHSNNGLAEIYKIALISNSAFWKNLPQLSLTEAAKQGVELKNKIVIKDPFDLNIRKSLNFGHTIGHAVESSRLSSSHPLLHGEAILVGMVIESHISLQKKLITKEQYNEVVKILSSVFTLPSVIDISFKSLLALMAHDKKATAKTLRFALLSGIGNAAIDVSVSETQIEKALSEYNILQNASS